MSETALADLAARVRRLEAERAIRDLKARYLRACDLKDAEGGTGSAGAASRWPPSSW